jgi:hypothetical protein
MHTLIPVATAFVFLAGCSSSSSSASPDSSTPSGSSSGGIEEDSSSCSSSGAGSSGGSSSSSSGSSSGGVSDAGDAAVVTFGVTVYPWMTEHCVGCHHPAEDGGTAGGGSKYGKLDLSTVDAAYPNLVNAPAQGVGPSTDIEAGVTSCDALPDGSAGSIRVVPGDAGASLLYLKVNGFTTAPPCGAPMPRSGEIPDGGQAQLVTAVQSWISQGANP